MYPNPADHPTQPGLLRETARQQSQAADPILDALGSLLEEPISPEEMIRVAGLPSGVVATCGMTKRLSTLGPSAALPPLPRPVWAQAAVLLHSRIRVAANHAGRAGASPLLYSCPPAPLRHITGGKLSRLIQQGKVGRRQILLARINQPQRSQGEARFCSATTSRTGCRERTAGRACRICRTCPGRPARPDAAARPRLQAELIARRPGRIPPPAHGAASRQAGVDQSPALQFCAPLFTPNGLHSGRRK